ncbi:MAG: 30S ribosomal protein S6 [Clostridia bacterium]|nr:30S ribosomal protein S6 [Clostridia bacterium]
MKNYEVLYIIKADVADDAKESVIEKFSTLVTSLNGTVDTVDKWGLKKYAYPINYTTEGYYVLMAFTAEESVPAEMNRQMRITDEVVRFMITSR